ncbi:MAG: MerR family transcriptional regulator [Myxococcales bacterium]|nr:MerR family transcriptional regulator [Myxococcales bacterium]MCB9754974.1 MerR family transcriptional regulator [Myxococcales bacterium]
MGAFGVPSKTGKYRIQAVSEITRVPAATLRAWERRYGIPSPQRTASSYRLYSDHDIALIQELQAMCAEGMSPAEAAQRLTESRAANEPVPALERIDPYERARDAVVHATRSFDPDAVEAAVQRALHLGSATTVYEKVVGPALRVIGERWYAGELSTGQEHMASEIIGNALRNTLRLVQPTEDARKAVLACFAEETHELPLLGIALRLCSWGFRTIILGARTPPSALRHATAELRPDLVGLSLTITPPPHEARTLIGDYAVACSDTPWIVGGKGTLALREQLERAGALVLTDEPTSKMKAAVERFIADHHGSRVSPGKPRKKSRTSKRGRSSRRAAPDAATTETTPLKSSDAS